jgi:hypothetical protein
MWSHHWLAHASQKNHACNDCMLDCLNKQRLNAQANTRWATQTVVFELMPQRFWQQSLVLPATVSLCAHLSQRSSICCAPCLKVSRTTRSKPTPLNTDMMGSVRSQSRCCTLLIWRAYSRTRWCICSQASPWEYRAAMKAPCSHNSTVRYAKHYTETCCVEIRTTESDRKPCCRSALKASTLVQSMLHTFPQRDVLSAICLPSQT